MGNFPEESRAYSNGGAEGRERGRNQEPKLPNTADLTNLPIYDPDLLPLNRVKRKRVGFGKYLGGDLGRGHIETPLGV